MKPFRIFLLSMTGLGLVSCEKEESVVAAGTYACTAYFVETTTYGGYKTTITRLPDTLLQISLADAHSVRVAGQLLPLQNGTEWRGHQPARAHQSFCDNPTYPLHWWLLQLDTSSDSLYFERTDSGHSYGQVWRYYGRRQQ